MKSYVHDDMAAEDIATEALIKLWQQMKKENVDPVQPFLFTVLKNRALDYLKHQAIKRNVHSSIAELLHKELEIRMTFLEASDPNDIFSDEVQKIIEATINSFPEKTKSIFILSRFGDKSYKEIAELYNFSVKGVGYHIALAVRGLRVALKDYVPLFGALFILGL